MAERSRAAVVRFSLCCFLLHLSNLGGNVLIAAQEGPGIVIAHPGQDVELLCAVTEDPENPTVTTAWLVNNMGPYRRSALRNGILAGYTTNLGSNNLIVENVMMNDDRNDSDYRCVIIPAQGMVTIADIIDESDPTILYVAGVPEIVSNLVAGIIINNKSNVTLTLSWGEPFNNLDPIVNYTVSCSGNDTCPPNFTTTDNTTRSYNITNLTPMADYTFSVVATNSIGSGEADVVMITTPPDGNTTINLTTSSVGMTTITSSVGMTTTTTSSVGMTTITSSVGMTTTTTSSVGMTTSTSSMGMITPISSVGMTTSTSSVGMITPTSSVGMTTFISSVHMDTTTTTTTTTTTSSVGMTNSTTSSVGMTTSTSSVGMTTSTSSVGMTTTNTTSSVDMTITTTTSSVGMTTTTTNTTSSVDMTTTTTSSVGMTTTNTTSSVDMITTTTTSSVGMTNSTTSSVGITTSTSSVGMTTSTSSVGMTTTTSSVGMTTSTSSVGMTTTTTTITTTTTTTTTKSNSNGGLIIVIVVVIIVLILCCFVIMNILFCYCCKRREQYDQNNEKDKTAHYSLIVLGILTCGTSVLLWWLYKECCGSKEKYNIEGHSAVPLSSTTTKSSKKNSRKDNNVSSKSADAEMTEAASIQGSPTELTYAETTKAFNGGTHTGPAVHYDYVGTGALKIAGIPDAGGSTQQPEPIMESYAMIQIIPAKDKKKDKQAKTDTKNQEPLVYAVVDKSKKKGRKDSKQKPKINYMDPTNLEFAEEPRNRTLSFDVDHTVQYADLAESLKYTNI